MGGTEINVRDKIVTFNRLLNRNIKELIIQFSNYMIFQDKKRTSDTRRHKLIYCQKETRTLNKTNAINHGYAKYEHLCLVTQIATFNRLKELMLKIQLSYYIMIQDKNRMPPMNDEHNNQFFVEVVTLESPHLNRHAAISMSVLRMSIACRQNPKLMQTCNSHANWMEFLIQLPVE